MEDFYIGQIFEGIYPPEAAEWVNANNAYIEALGDGNYQIKAIPPESEEEIKQKEITEIKTKLNELDLKSIRALRANDVEFIEKYEAQAAEFRARLAELSI